MTIVGGLDIHRAQITFDVVDTETGEHHRGRITAACREQVRWWASQFQGQEAKMAIEGCTGWRYVSEELERAGCEVHVAEPADTQAARGPKRRAKTSVYGPRPESARFHAILVLCERLSSLMTSSSLL